MNSFNHEIEATYFLNLHIPKKKPKYFQELKWLSKQSLIFIAVDTLALQMIRRFEKACLFCPQDPNVYDVDFCYRREVWVLYSHVLYFMNATQLAYRIQHWGATKVSALLVDRHFAEEYPHD